MVKRYFFINWKTLNCISFYFPQIKSKSVMQSMPKSHNVIQLDQVIPKCIWKLNGQEYPKHSLKRTRLALSDIKTHFLKEWYESWVEKIQTYEQTKI